MPVVTTDASVQTQANRAADLTAKKAADLALATIHLFSNNYNPLPTSVVADFTEAVFTGYAAQPVAGWNANQLSQDGSVSTDATTVLTWVGPNDPTGQTIYGYYVLSAGMGTPLVYAVRFPTPVALAVPTNVLALVVTYRSP